MIIFIKSCGVCSGKEIPVPANIYVPHNYLDFNPNYVPDADEFQAE